jgi:hypothetical protein
MGFLCFAHKKTMDRSASLCADDRRGNNDGIGSHGQPAHRLRLPALLLNEFQKDTSGKFRAMGMKRGGAAINVVVAFAAGSQRKFTQAERVGSQQIEKLFAKS